MTTKICVTYTMCKDGGTYETCTDLPVSEEYAELLVNAEKIPTLNEVLYEFRSIEGLLCDDLHTPEMNAFYTLYYALEGLMRLQEFDAIDEIETIERVDGSTAAADEDA